MWALPVAAASKSSSNLSPEVMRPEILKALNEARSANRAIVRATDLATGEDILIDPATDKSPHSAPPPRMPRGPIKARPPRSKAATGFSPSSIRRWIS